ncbi:MAG: twin-arginine translocase TatA/TatE family subunit [Acidobacteriota bacterium]|nr:twin-arginine translocase TatA/TatE family subunit [Acidobacteriota bacterium]
MVLLILESLGSTELLFILVMALVFFGPRKLPQLSRSLGKNLAEFRRASEEFKATWNREVSLEEFNDIGSTVDRSLPAKENSILESETLDQPLQPPFVEAVAPDRVIPHQPGKSDALNSSAKTDLSSGGTDSEMVTVLAEPSRKRDWL